MPSEPVWLAADQVEIINQRLVEATGEPFAVARRQLLESACARPQNYWGYGERDLARLACVLLFGVARNHPFIQGNKRAAFAAAVIFVEANGARFEVPDTSEFADALVAVIDGEMAEEEFIAIFRQHLVAGTD